MMCDRVPRLGQEAPVRRCRRVKKPMEPAARVCSFHPRMIDGKDDWRLLETERLLDDAPLLGGPL